MGPFLFEPWRQWAHFAERTLAVPPVNLAGAGSWMDVHLCARMLAARSARGLASLARPSGADSKVSSSTVPMALYRRKII